MRDVLISVVIPNYNYGHFILQALDSVYAQSHRKLEVIVCDDGSTDNSVSLIKEKYPAVIIIQNNHGGVSKSRNTGIARATGKYIAFLDSDDIWHPNKIEYQLAALKSQPSWDYVGTGLEDEHSSFALFNNQPHYTRLSAIDFLTIIPISSSDIIIKRKCFKKIGNFDETLHGAEDKDMWIRLAMKYKGGKVELPLWKYRTHDNQSNRNPKLINSTRSIVIKKNFRKHPIYCFMRFPKILGHHFYEAAIIHRDEDGSNIKALYYIGLSIIVAPYTYHQKDTISNRVKFLLLSLKKIAQRQYYKFK